MFVLTLTDQHENQMEYPLGSWKCKNNTQEVRAGEQKFRNNAH